MPVRRRQPEESWDGGWIYRGDVNSVQAGPEAMRRRGEGPKGETWFLWYGISGEDDLIGRIAGRQGPSVEVIERVLLC